MNSDLTAIWFYDFHYFWAAGSVFLSGGSPYSYSDFEAAVKLTNWRAGEAVPPFPHPPWTLPLYALFAASSFSVGLVFWIALMITLAAVCFKLVDRLTLSFSSLTRWKLGAGLLLFPATYSTFYNAQINFFILLGLLLLALYWDKSQLLALAGLSFTLIKPHLFIPLYLWVAVSLIKQRRYARILVVPTLLLVFSLFSELISPGISSAYVRAVPLFASLHQNLPGAALSQVLSFNQPPTYLWLSLLLSSSMVATYFASRSQIQPLAQMRIVLVLSILSASYIWPHTFLVLAYPYAVIMCRMLRYSERLYQLWVCAFGLVGLLQLAQPWQYSWSLAWFPLLLLWFELRELKAAAKVSGSAYG